MPDWVVEEERERRKRRHQDREKQLGSISVTKKSQDSSSFEKYNVLKLTKIVYPCSRDPASTSQSADENKKENGKERRKKKEDGTKHEVSINEEPYISKGDSGKSKKISLVKDEVIYYSTDFLELFFIQNKV